MVKSMFAHEHFRDRVHMSAVNSINWGRVMAQVVYYFTAATSLGGPARKVSFTVPTGNFGDIYAGFVARQMGLPIARLVIATNENDILARTLATGQYRLGKLIATITPSMDIQISSNFERLLFDVSGRQPAAVCELMQELKQTGSYTLPDQMRTEIGAVFEAGRASETQTLAEITRLYETSGYLCDPHTAVALHVARQHATADTPMVTFSTAHPGKFSKAVHKATGTTPSLPKWGDSAADALEVVTRLKNDQDTVEAFIREHSRLGSGKNS